MFAPLPCFFCEWHSAADDEADEDLEGEGYAIPDHAVLYDVDMDPEDRTAVFDLALSQDSDDGGLLDWDALAGVFTKPLCCIHPP